MKRNILVVDDEPEISQAIKTSLERQGNFEVEIANGGQEALSKIATKVPDLIVLDVMMPVIAGDELLGLIRRNYKTLDIPVIISTVKYDAASLVKFMNLGATDYLMKPYDSNELIKLINMYT